MADTPLPLESELRSLRSDTSHDWGAATKGRAPHKPFLLLAVIDGIESGWIEGPQIELSHDLKETFYTYWNAVMRSDQVTSIALPFYHMQGEAFWELVYKKSMEPYQTTPSVGGLRTRVHHAELDQKLYEGFSDPLMRDRYRELLLDTYFDETTADTLRELVDLNRMAYDYSEGLLERAADPFVKYIDESDAPDRYTETTVRRQARDKGFRRSIRLIYDDTCALCRARVVTEQDESLIEGAHIIPWQENGTDDPTTAWPSAAPITGCSTGICTPLTMTTGSYSPTGSNGKIIELRKCLKWRGRRYACR